jgi:heptosyltransferase II
MKKLENIHKILVINLGGIGDLLLSTPALRAIKDAYPAARMTLLIVPRTLEVVKDLPYVDEVAVFYKEPLRIFENIRLIMALRSRCFDIAVNMRTLVSRLSAAKMRFLMDVISPRVKAGRDTEGAGRFFDIKIPETYVAKKPEMEYDIDAATALGAVVAGRHIDLKIDEMSLRRAEKMLESHGIGAGDILVGIHPGGMPSRRWPAGNFAGLLRSVGAKVSCKFVITGSKDEACIGNQIINISGTKAVNLAGRLSLKEMAAVIKRCNVFISNDTGPMHIAAVLETPLVAILGPGDITRFDPRIISDRARVVYKKAPCAPCVRYRCNDMQCLKAISEEEVTMEALAWLK